MKAVYMAIIILASIMAYGFANAETESTVSPVLEDYYSNYVSEVGVLKAHKVEKRVKGGWNCYPYGDDEVGFFRTMEQYQNAYDPAIFAVE